MAIKEKYFKLVLKTIYKKVFLKYQANTRSFIAFDLWESHIWQWKEEKKVGNPISLIKGDPIRG